MGGREKGGKKDRKVFKKGLCLHELSGIFDAIPNH